MGRGAASGWNMEFCFQRTIGSIHVVTMDFNPWDMKGKKLEFHRNGAYDEESFSRENLFHSCRTGL